MDASIDLVDYGDEEEFCPSAIFCVHEEPIDICGSTKDYDEGLIAKLEGVRLSNTTCGRKMEQASTKGV
jgi:hypothetical protein